MFVEAKLFHKAGEGSGGGGDQHNLGWYASKTDLETAYPTASAGDWAIVGSTDTVWVWDTDTTAWVDTDQKGQVTSVNNQTGDVTIGTNDVLPSQTGNSGKFLTTDGTDASWATVDALPSQTGNSGKFLTTNGTAASWATVDALPSQTGHSGEVLTTDGSAASWTTPTTVTFRTWGANE